MVGDLFKLWSKYQFYCFYGYDALYFNRAFPLKIVYVRELNGSGWITQWIKFLVKECGF
jgi:hypothetical protein